MASKRKAFVHIGLGDGAGDFVDGALERHSRALAELGVFRPATSREEMFRAALEILRDHGDWGYTRAEVEGAWTDIVRRGHQGKDTLVFSQPLLSGARPEQVALLIDALLGFEIHVVVTVHAPDAWTVPGEGRHDLGAVLETWRTAVTKPGRLHVIVAGERPATWKDFGRVVGFGTSSLSLADLPTPAVARPPHQAPASRAEVLHRLGESWVELLSTAEYDVVGDVAALVPDTAESSATADRPGSEPAQSVEHALDDALIEIERLTRRNESLQIKVAALEKKRKKLKRKLSAAA